MFEPTPKTLDPATPTLCESKSLDFTVNRFFMKLFSTGILNMLYVCGSKRLCFLA